MDITGLKDQFSRFKGSEFRLGQEEAIQYALDSRRKVVMICAPTGSGKSLIGTCAGVHHPRFCYTCVSKQLQAQLVEDFPETMLMMGRGNFRCNKNPYLSADQCVHTKVSPCDLKPICEYEVHKRRVANHPMQILNYHYLLAEGNYVGKFSGYPLMVCDEADEVEGLLTSFIELRISKKRLDSLRLSPPRYKTSTARHGLESWKEWVEGEARLRVIAKIDNLERSLKGGMDQALLEEKKSLEAFLNKLDIFEQYMDTTWLFQEQKVNGYVTAWVFSPTWLTPELSQAYFFRHAEKFIFMSATFPPKPVMASMLGLNPGDIDHIEIPSTFPLSNRPVILKPVADMSYKTKGKELPALLEEILHIIDSHRGEKGIIHSHSWELTDAIMSMNHPRLMSHSRLNGDKNEALELFYESKDKVFVSPSCARGVDLYDDRCRFIVLPKAPFQGLSDKLVKARVNDHGIGTYWYRSMAAMAIVQGSGRGMRHKDDYCTTYLLDKQIEKLVVDNQGLFPRYWMEAVDYE